MAFGGDLTEKQRMLLWGVGMGVVAILLGVGLYMGKSKHSAITKKAEEQRDLLQHYQDQVHDKKTVETELEQIREKTKPYLQLLPNKREADRLIRKLYEVAQDTGIAWKRTSKPTYRSHPTKPQYQVIEYKLQFEAGFHQMVKFINYLEDNFDRFLQVDDMSISAERGGLLPGAKNHGVDLKLITYVYAGAGGM